MAKKTRVEDIDSDAIINSFRQDDTSIPPGARSTEGVTVKPRAPQPTRSVPAPASVPVPSATDAGVERTDGAFDYDGTFVREANITARLGKQVYIKKEYHDRIQKMLHVIGGNEVSIASFLHNVLSHHFTLFQDEIAESFNRHMKDYNL